MTPAAFFLAVALAKGSPTVAVDPAEGTYTVDVPGWHCAGRVVGTLEGLQSRRGVDRIGRYAETSFEWNESGPVRGTIRAYDDRPVVWFRVHYLAARPDHGVVFPNFTTFPGHVSAISFRDSAFAPPVKGLAQTSTPWLFSNQIGAACVFSPASQFLISKMTGSLDTAVGEGLNLRLDGVPSGLDQDSLIASGDDVQGAWDAWGAALRALYRRSPARYDADPLLRSFGYWTDNGADYYYNYDPSLGYAGTLLAVKDRYAREGIPLGYVQLDSWWYPKSLDDAAGRPGKPKNASLPLQSWNRYGGLLDLRAHPALFPGGLDAFDLRLGLPLAVHSRWIDHNSAYHARYRISGVGAIDPAWWRDTADYLRANGVTTYEQDWLSEIYGHSPEMASKAGIADAFADGMANSMARDGLTMQYCMATPRFFLQGVKYPNLTTIRTSGDRFEPRKWPDFLFTSQLAYEVGIAPWCDVFKSSETGNLILSVLSCGPVGTGDALGMENVANIKWATRADGVIVKPDRPAVPTNDTWAAFAANDRTKPFVARTWTDHAAGRTTYVFAFNQHGEESDDIDAVRLGIDRPSYMFDLRSGRGSTIAPGNQVHLNFASRNFEYLMFAPIQPCGIAIIGVQDNIVPTGKQRVVQIRQEKDGVVVRLRFAHSESRLVLNGYAPKLPRFRVSGGVVSQSAFDEKALRFWVSITPSSPGSDVDVHLIAER